MSALEEGKELRLDFTKLEKVAALKAGVIPVAVQNEETKEVILIAYANEAALRRTIETGIACFWSTSRNELWEKGRTSGDSYAIVRILVNCEQNSLVYIVRPQQGGICHTKNRRGESRNCYYRAIDFETMTLVNLDP